MPFCSVHLRVKSFFEKEIDAVLVKRFYLPFFVIFIQFFLLLDRYGVFVVTKISL